jgi:hypothetical protein
VALGAEVGAAERGLGLTVERARLAGEAHGDVDALHRGRAPGDLEHVGQRADPLAQEEGVAVAGVGQGGGRVVGEVVADRLAEAGGEGLKLLGAGWAQGLQQAEQLTLRRRAGR